MDVSVTKRNSGSTINFVLHLFITAGPHCLQCNRCINDGRVRLFACPSLTFRCFVQTNEATIMRFSLLGRKIILVSGEVKIIGKFARDHPQRGR